MSRQIITADDAKAIEQDNQRILELIKKKTASDPEPPPLKTVPEPNSYEKRLLLLIPADVIAVFIALDGVIRAAAPGTVPATAYWVVFAVLVVGAYFYVLKSAVGPNRQAAHPHLHAIIAVLAFIVWVFAIGGPFTYDASMSTWYNPVFGAILLPLFTFLIPLAMPGPGPGQGGS